MATSVQLPPRQGSSALVLTKGPASINHATREWNAGLHPGPPAHPSPTLSFSFQIPANHRHCHQQHERAPKPFHVGWGGMCAPFPIKAQKLPASAPFQTNTDSCFCTANEKTQSNKLKPSCEGEVESASLFFSLISTQQQSMKAANKFHNDSHFYPKQQTLNDVLLVIGYSEMF